MQTAPSSLPQGVIPLGGCVVSANESLGMPFAIVVNLEDFTVSCTPWVCRRSASPLLVS